MKVSALQETITELFLLIIKFRFWKTKDVMSTKHILPHNSQGRIIVTNFMWFFFLRKQSRKLPLMFETLKSLHDSKWKHDPYDVFECGQNSSEHTKKQVEEKSHSDFYSNRVQFPFHCQIMSLVKQHVVLY